MDCVAFESSVIEAYPSKQAWDASAAELVATMLDRWQLTPGEAFVGGEAGSALRVTTAEGTPAVLKVGFPHIEGVWEAVGLQAWGDGLAPEVLRQDPWTWSLLLEAVEPGIPLSRHELPAVEAVEIAAELYRELSARPAPEGIPTLAEIVGDYLRDATARLPEQHAALVELGALDLLERGLAEAGELAETDGAGSFLHGDYNPGNILLERRGGAERWLVIDPKPMLGDPEFELFPLVAQLGSLWTKPHPASQLGAQLDLAAGIIGCDLARATRWGFARAALNLNWSLDDGNRTAAVRDVIELRAWAELSGS